MYGEMNSASSGCPAVMSDYFDCEALLMYWVAASWFYASLLSLATVLFFLFIRKQRSRSLKSLKIPTQSNERRVNVYRFTSDFENTTYEATSSWKMLYSDQNSFVDASESQSIVNDTCEIGAETFAKEPVNLDTGVSILDAVDMDQANMDNSDLAVLECSDTDLIVPAESHSKLSEDKNEKDKNDLNETVSEGSDYESMEYTFEDSLEDMTESDVVDLDMLVEDNDIAKPSECMTHLKETSKDENELNDNIIVEKTSVKDEKNYKDPVDIVEESDSVINEIVVPNTDGYNSCTVIDTEPYKVSSNVERTVKSVKEDLIKQLSTSSASELSENHTKLMLQCIPNEIVKKLSKEFDKLSSKSNVAVSQVDSNRKVKIKTSDFKEDGDSNNPESVLESDLSKLNGNCQQDREEINNFEEATTGNVIRIFVKELLEEVICKTPTAVVESSPIHELKSVSKDKLEHDNEQNKPSNVAKSYSPEGKTDILVYQSDNPGKGLTPNDLTVKLLDFTSPNSSNDCVGIPNTNHTTPETLFVNNGQMFSRNHHFSKSPRSFSRSALTSRIKKLVPFKKKITQRSLEPSNERVRDKSKRIYAYMVEELYGNPPVDTANDSETVIVNDQGPSSKGDEFHASSDKINEQVNVLKNHILKKHETPKLLSKRAKELHCEEAIQSISYDGLAASSSKTDKSSDDIKSHEDSTILESDGSLYSKQSEPEISNSDTRDQDTSVSYINIVESDSKIDKVSILTDLLDMSQSNEHSTEDVSKETVSEKPSEATSDGKSDTSSALYFIKDSVENAEMLVNRATSIDGFIPIIRSGASNEHIKIGRLPGENVLAQKILHLDNFKEDALDTHVIETNISPEHLIEDLSNVSTGNKESRQSVDDTNKPTDVIVPNRTFHDANNTSELLEMLSRLTDKTVSNSLSFVTKNSAKENRLNPSYESCLNEPNVSLKESFNNVQNEPKKEVRKRLSVCFKDNSLESMDRSLDRTSVQSKESSKNLNEKTSDSSILVEEVIATPLKKVTITERKYIKDCRSKVIPTYEITDGIKELMNDLVKPMADVMPFQSVRPSHRVRKKESTCSTQIQANLITSSQIDLDVEHECGIKSLPIPNIPKSIMKKPSSEMEEEKPDLTIRRPMNLDNNRVVVFDHDNPLNNVLLLPFDYTKVHKYEPLKDKTDAEHREQYRSNFEVERVTVEYNLMSIIAPKMYFSSSGSDTSKPASMDQAIDVDLVQLADNQVNTEIAMKDTSDILDTYSSLTLIQDDRSERFMHNFEKGDLQDEVITQNPVNTHHQTKYKTKLAHDKKFVKDTNRKRDTFDRKYLKLTLTAKKSKLRAKMKAKQLTKEQLITQKNAMEEEIMKPIINFSYDSNDEERLSEVSSSLSNSCDQGETDRSKGRRSSTGSSNWSSLDQHSSKNIVADLEGSANVVAKIDMLPFIGSRDCEWNACGMDTWSFRLLHGRVQMVVKLEHKIDNATRHFVRADTKVLAVHFDKVFEDKPNSVSEMCVRFALSSMRDATSFIRFAGDVPRALRLASSVSNVALRWARAMADAKERLAFTIDNDNIILKVANVALRSVWEVSLAVSSAQWPLVARVLVWPLVADAAPSEQRLARLSHSAPDWGHVPRTIWKVFKYLKFMTPDDDLILSK